MPRHGYMIFSSSRIHAGSSLNQKRNQSILGAAHALCTHHAAGGAISTLCVFSLPSPSHREKKKGKKRKTRVVLLAVKLCGGEKHTLAVCVLLRVCVPRYI